MKSHHQMRIACLAVVALLSLQAARSDSLYQVPVSATIETAGWGCTVSVSVAGGGGGPVDISYTTCINPARFFFNVGLDPDVTYGGSFARTPAWPRVCAAYVGAPDVGCFQTVSHVDSFDPNAPPASINFTLSSVASHKFIAWDFPKDGIQALTADGMSSVHGSVTVGSGALGWAFDGPDLGCRLAGDNTGVTVTAGTNTGTVMIKATTGTNTCFSIPLDLVECNASGCSACGAGGGLSVGQGSVDIKIGMGWSLRGGSAGFLRVRESAPTNTIASPRGLHYDYRRADVQVFTNTAGITQVKSLQQLANVISNSPSSYSIQLFTPTNVLSLTNGTGHDLTGSPFQTITITNLNGDTNFVRVIDSNDAFVYDYEWQTNGWLLTSGGGLRKELKTTVYSASNTIATVTTTIFSGANPPVRSKIETWQSFSTNGQRLTQDVLGTGSTAKTNSYTYTPDGYLQQTMRWDGTWDYTVYDSSNRPVNVYSGFLNQAVTTNSALCRMVAYDYTTNVISGAGDNGSMYFRTPRRTIEYIQNVEVGRKYFVALQAERHEIQCTATGAAWNDANNLVTTYKLFTNGLRLNEPWIIQKPDGTAQVFRYGPVYSTITNFVSTGHLDGTGTNVDAGTQEMTVSSSSGLLLARTIIDIQSGLVTEYETHGYDDLARKTSTTYLDGTSDQLAYDCCSLTSQTNRDGTVTTFTHDALKRPLTTTVNGITSSNVYDPAGRIIATVRYGSDSSAITTSQSSFNDADDLISSTDALNNTTTYTNYFDASGQLVRETIFPDLGTKLETCYQDGSLHSISGTAAFPLQYGFGTENDGSGRTSTYRNEIKLDRSGGTNEWTKTYTDTAGRVYKTIHAGPTSPTYTSYFNNFGQLTNTVDPDGVSTLYAFNQKGEQYLTVLDTNRDYVIDYSGSDRITFVTNDVVADNGTTVLRTRTFAWSTNGVAASNLVSTTETSADGLQMWTTIWNNGVAVSRHSATFIDAAHGLRVITNTAPDNSYTVTTNQYGRLVSATRFDSANNKLSGTSYGYDPHGRQSQVTDLRSGTTTYYFNDADQITGIATPVPAAGQTSQTTSNFFDPMGRIIATKLPDNTYVTNQYDVTGSLTNTYGSRTYPVTYTYDAQGRMKTMTTFGAAGTATTTWNHDIYRGWLTNKTYGGGTPGPKYTYTAAGRLASRLWARGTNTVYTYDSLGSLTNIAYNDGTVDCTYAYDRRGRQVQRKEGSTLLSSVLFDDAGNVLSETYSSGPLSGLSVTNIYDSMLRRPTNGLWNGSAWLTQTRYIYDAASRLLSVSDGTNSATYAYVANSPLVSQISFTNGATQRMVTTKQFDLLNRLTNISSFFAPAYPSFSYNYNSANQRTQRTDTDNSYWAYTYDALGQVTSGKHYWPDGTPIAGQQYEYGFDNIGNRTVARTGGDQFNGSYLRSANYTNNSLNQITSRDVPGYFNAIGSANSNATVTLWRDDGEFATSYRHGDYFRAELPVNNSTGALWLTLTNLAILQTGTNHDVIASATGNAFVPKTPETFGHDLDGNMTNDGRFSIIWDAENRATSFTSLTSTPAASRVKVDCTYDYQWRRTQKVVSTWNPSTLNYQPSTTNRYVYDGWNLIAILDSQSSILYSFTWGTDLSGSEQGAGGIGGLISMKVHTGPLAGSYFYVFDGNGNVMMLVNATDGSIAAQYEYGPFGELLRASGPLTLVNPFRFSTKFQDDETGFVYYGYRYYDPSTGRWLSRDPLGEPSVGLLMLSSLQASTGAQFDEEMERINRLSNDLSGPNLYAFCVNSPLTRVDRHGLDSDYPTYWGVPGPITSTPGAYGPIYNPHPDWFLHPTDEGKPCCCRPPARIRVTREDELALFAIRMVADVHITGCYKDFVVIWDTCWRYDHVPWGSESSGAIPDAVNSLTARFWAYGQVYLTHANIRYLSCEDGKWKTKIVSAGRTYTRALPGMLPWSYTDLISYQ